MPVVATTPTPVLITRIAHYLKSNYTSGNHWYFNDSLISINDTVSLIGPGPYKDVVTDSVGCDLVSNIYTYSTSNDIGLFVLPNPNNGTFSVQFYLATASSANLRVLDINGQQLYQSDNPNFQGFFNKRINLGAVSAGTYVLQVIIGSKSYVQKIVIL